MAFPFGGEGFPEYALMELHYDNQKMVAGKSEPKLTWGTMASALPYVETNCMPSIPQKS